MTTEVCSGRGLAENIGNLEILDTFSLSCSQHTDILLKEDILLSGTPHMVDVSILVREF
ncbi:hypothetical protein TUMSATVNIG3_20610 [Vibrio nigripulchritudo]|nr:hypothetical protein TUMSATVNIG2_20110 [Vibrio nigripulchritudo]BDU43263.1 hypothetical protein TUMSATVNIG3_20610 [Vibrio nigripulchritudo]